MTNYEVKCKLKSITGLRQTIEYELLKLDMMRELATSVNVTMEDVKVQKSKNIHKLEDDVIKIVDYANHIKQKVNTLMRRIENTEKWIDCLNEDIIKCILKEKYICDLTFESIAAKYHYNISHIFRLHDKGIRELTKIKLIKDDRK